MTGLDYADKSAQREFERFVFWALGALRFDVRYGDESQAGAAVVSIPESFAEPYQGQREVRIAFGEKDVSSDVVWVDSGGPFFAWLVRQLQRNDAAVHSVPRRQPYQVHEFSSQLFAAYRVEEGSTHLAGCTLEDKPLLRLTYVDRGAESDARGAAPFHVYFDRDGRPLDAVLVGNLHLDELDALERSPSGMDQQRLQEWLETADQWVIERGAQPADEESPRHPELIVAAIVWCKFAAGKLRFEAGDHAAELPFEMWAQRIIDGESPPAFRCPWTGAESHHVTFLSDGRVTVPEAVGICEQSGVRVLTGELTACALTGQRVVEEYLARCPVSGEWVLRDRLRQCGICGQWVSPAVPAGRWPHCGHLQSVAADEPRMARVLGEHPGLDRWSTWQLLETPDSYVLQGVAWMRRILLEVDRESLEPRRVAIGNRFRRRLTELAPDQFHAQLR